MNTMVQTFVGLSVAALMATAAQAGEKVDKKLNVSANTTVDVEVIRGRVSIEGWDQPVVSVSGTLDDKTERFVFETSGNRTHIRVELPKNMRGHSDGSDLVIKVPVQAALDVDFVTTDLTLNNIAGDVDAETVSGEIKASKLGHNVALESVSGSVELRGAGKRVELESVSGDVTAAVTAERLKAHSVSGNVRVRNEGKLGILNAGSVSGDVTIDSALSNDIDADIETVSGSITLHVRGEMNARIDASTGPGGDITNNLTNDKPNRSFVGSEELKLRLGDAGGRIELSVVSGEITLSK